MSNELTEPDKNAVIVNGWTLFAHPLFLAQLEELTQKVESLRRKEPEKWKSKDQTKRLAAIHRLAFEIIPANPANQVFRLGDSLGNHPGWFRAKFFQQYRLFFRFDSKSKVIVYAWVNDEATKRAYESDSDAYRVFRKMLDKGNPPDDWDALVKAVEGMRK